MPLEQLLTMDLIESGAIFNFNPFNVDQNKSNDSSTKHISRFEELFMASPRAKELSSTADISSYLSSSTSYEQYTPRTGIMSGYHGLDNPRNYATAFDSHSTLFSPLITSPDSRFDLLKSQVTEVISSLRTPKSNDEAGASKDSVRGSGTTTRKAFSFSGLSDTRDIDSTLQTLSKNDSKGNVNTQETDKDDDDDDMIPAHDTDDIRVCDDTEEPQKPHDENSDFVSDNHDIGKCLNDRDDTVADIDNATPDKEPLPPNTATEATAETAKKPHHLSEWCIKAVRIKNNPPGIIVEGQRPGDSMGFKWHSTTIVKMVNSHLLETKRKSQYFLDGQIQEDVTLEQGFSTAFVEAFKNGFPANWKELVQEHFDSLRSPKKIVNNNKSKPTKTAKPKQKVVQREKAAKAKRTRTETPPQQTNVTPIEVELKRTSSGRLIKPPLAWWRGQRILTDRQHNLTAIDPGGEEHTALSVGLYNFDLKVPKNKQILLQSKDMTPRVAKYDLIPSPTEKSKKVKKSAPTKTASSKSKMAKKKGPSGTEIIPSSKASGNASSKDKNSKKCFSDGTDTDTEDSAANDKSRPKNTRLRHLRNKNNLKRGSETTEQNFTKNEGSSKSSGRKPAVDSMSEESPGRTTTGDEEEDEGTVDSVKRNISFSDELELADSNSDSEICKLSDPPKVDSPQQPIAKSIPKRGGKENILEDDTKQLSNKKSTTQTSSTDNDQDNDQDKESLSSQDEDTRHYSLRHKSRTQTVQTRPGKKDFTKVQEPIASENLPRQTENFESQGKDTKTTKAVKLQKTKIVNEEYVLPNLRFRNRTNLVSTTRTNESEHSSSSDEEEEEAIVAMVKQAKERKSKRESQIQEGVVPQPTANKAAGNRSKTKPVTENKKDLDGTQWKDDEIMRFAKALHAIPLNSPRFWQKVAESVETRTAQECQSNYEGQLLEGKPKREIKTKQAKPTQKVVAITGGVGTVKRKRELRQLIQQTNQGYDDDIFDSTPYKKSKTNFKISLEACSSSDDEDYDDDDDDFVEEQNNKDFKTPSSRTPSSRFRPLGPVINSSNTPTADLISPSLLQPVDRAGMDHYIQRMKQGRKGFYGPNKKVKTSTPKKKVSIRIPKVNSSIFEVHEAPDHDSEEGSDDYFSSND